MMQPPRQALAAGGGSIDVWLAFYDEIRDPSLHADYRALLTDEETKRAAGAFGNFVRLPSIYLPFVPSAAVARYRP